MRLTPTANPQISEIAGVLGTVFLLPTCGVHFSSQYPCLLSLLMMVAFTLEQLEWRVRNRLAEREPVGLEVVGSAPPHTFLAVTWCCQGPKSVPWPHC